MGNHTIIMDMPAEERPREKMLNQGCAALSNSELLALLIRTGTRSASALTVAADILAIEGKGLSFLNGCLPEELARIEGIGLAKACQIVAAVELGRRIASIPREKRVDVRNPQDVSEIMMNKMRHLMKEHFQAVILNTRHEILAIDTISIGSVNSSVAYPREVFEKALRRGGVAIILVHNHRTTRS